MSIGTHLLTKVSYKAVGCQSKSKGTLSWFAEYIFHIHNIYVFKVNVTFQFPLENNLNFFKSLPF